MDQIRDQIKYTWATLDHYSSTFENPKHDNYPSGKKGWCRYQRDIASKKSLHKPLKWPFTDAILAVITPAFQWLVSVKFLESCKSCRAQNPNKVLNHVIWSLAPKELYDSPLETCLAIILGVCLFNNDIQYTYSNLIEMAGIVTKHTMLNKWAKIDSYRVYKENYAESKDEKNKEW